MTMRLGTAQVIQGNALALPLPDSSVDLICTSPPYFGLRSYQDSCQTCGGVDQSGPKMSGPSANSTLTGSKANRSGTDRDGQTPDPACTDCGGTGKGHYDGQIGSEATPAEFLDALLAATREMVRVLKPSGSIFVNLGDKYAQNVSRNGYDGALTSGAVLPEPVYSERRDYGRVRTKSLIGIPWRYAIACIDQLQLILRAEIIWAKPNGLPESVTDRVRRSHEQWFHLVKQPRYFSAVDEIREPQVGSAVPVGRRDSDYWRRANAPQNALGRQELGWDVGERVYDPRGKLPGSVWTIPTQPLTVPAELGVDHFAAYPMEWPRRIIQGWTPNGICTECSEGRRPAVTNEYVPIGNRQTNVRVMGMQALGDSGKGRPGGPDSRLGDARKDVTITGYVCACTPYTDHPERRGRDFLAGADRNKEGRTGNSNERNRAYREGTSGPSGPIREYHLEDWTPAPTTPAVVLDPFGGTGTTALVAKALGRTGITIDLSSDYCRLAEWRCNDPRELAAALQIEKPDVVHPDQLDLFSEAP